MGFFNKLFNTPTQTITKYIPINNWRGRAVYNNFVPELSVLDADKVYNNVWGIGLGYLGSFRQVVDTMKRHAFVLQSRKWELQSPILSRLCDLFEEFTVGQKGIVITPSSGNKNFDRKATEYFNHWAEKECDIRKMFSLYELQGTMAHTWFIDGEYFVLLDYDEKGIPVVRLVETQEVQNSSGEKNPYVIDGIEYDKNLRPKYYWIKDVLGEKITRYGAEKVIHRFTPIRPNQLRGLPYCYSVLKHLECYEKVLRYEMENAKNMATKSAVLTTETGTIEEPPDSSVIINDLINNTTSSSDLTDEETVQKKLAELEQQEVLRKKAIEQTYGGAVSILKPGENIVELGTIRPTSGTQAMFSILLNHICQGIGIGRVLYEMESAQGTVVRAWMELQKSFFQAHANMLGEDLSRIYSHAMSRFPVGGQKNWDKCTISLPKYLITDIGYDAEKEIKELQNGLKTYREAYGDRGGEFEQIAIEKAREVSRLKEIADEYGLTLKELLSNGLSALEEQDNVWDTENNSQAGDNYIQLNKGTQKPKPDSKDDSKQDKE